MKKKSNSLFSVFLTMIKVGCIGFGGGNAVIPVLYGKTVKEQQMITDDEYEEDVMIASITPGALPVEIAAGIGHRVGGCLGMLCGCFGMSLPGVIATVFLLIFLNGISDNLSNQVRFVAIGISAFIIVLLTEYIRDAIVRGKKQTDRKYSVMIIALVFLFTCGKNLYKFLGVSASPILGLSTVCVFVATFFVMLSYETRDTPFLQTLMIFIAVLYIVLSSHFLNDVSRSLKTCVYIGMIVSAFVCIARLVKRERKTLILKDTSRITDILCLFCISLFFIILASFWIPTTTVFSGRALFSSLISFGGGDAYLTVADGLFVDTSMIDGDVFYGNVVPVINILPGSILCKTLSGVGYYIGLNLTGNIMCGVLMAMLGYSISVFASVGIFSIVHTYYGIIKELTFFSLLKRWIRPIVAGLMFSVILSLLNQAKTIGSSSDDWAHICILVGLALGGRFLYARKISSLVIIGTLIVSSIILCNISFILL